MTQSTRIGAPAVTDRQHTVPHWPHQYHYHKTSNISRTLIGNKIIDNSDVVGASPVGAAPSTSSFSTQHLASMDWAKTTAKGDKKHLSFGIWCDLYWRFYGSMLNQPCDRSVDPVESQLMPPGPRLNIKTVLSTYGVFHVKDKTAVRKSYL